MNDTFFLNYALAAFAAVCGFLGIQAMSRRINPPFFTTFFLSIIIFISIPIATVITGVSLDDFLVEKIGKPGARIVHRIMGRDENGIDLPQTTPTPTPRTPAPKDPEPIPDLRDAIPRPLPQAPRWEDQPIVPRGNPETDWEFYGRVASLTPYTHLVKRNIRVLNIRNGPGTEFSIVGTQEGTSCLRVIETRGDWAKVVVLTESGPWAYYAYAKSLEPKPPSVRCG